MARKKQGKLKAKDKPELEVAGTTSDPDNYARMIIPHETIEEAGAAWRGFWSDVYEARKKHRIAEVVTVGQVRWKDEDGKLMGSNITASMGNDASVLRMLAAAYGEMKLKYDRLIMQLEQAEVPPTVEES